MFEPLVVEDTQTDIFSGTLKLESSNSYNRRYRWRDVITRCQQTNAETGQQNQELHQYLHHQMLSCFRILDTFLAPSRSPRSHSVCVSVCLSVRSAQSCLKVSIFILDQSGSVYGQSKVSLRSVSGQSQGSPRSVPGLSQVSLRLLHQ